MDRLSIISGALFFCGKRFRGDQPSYARLDRHREWWDNPTGVDAVVPHDLQQAHRLLHPYTVFRVVDHLNSNTCWLSVCDLDPGVVVHLHLGEAAGPRRQVVRLCCSYIFLCCGSCVSDGVQARGDRRRSLPASKLIQCWNFLHFLRDGLVDNGHLRTLRKQNLFATFLAWSLGVKETLE